MNVDNKIKIMDISFILLTWNSEKYIGKCLGSLFADLNGNPFSYEIFIVDNGSKDNTIKIINLFKDRYHKRIIPIYLQKNTGTTYSRNLALRKAKGDFIVIMDSDVEVSPGSIEQLINAIKQNKEAGILAPRLL
jgi:glycosyltransferase involved in cell wall biosynthesis